MLVLATGLLLLTGCGDRGMPNPVPDRAGKLVVHSPWRDGGRIPRLYTCDGRDIAPIVGTLTQLGRVRSYAFVMTDPDAPGGNFVHWVRWGDRSGRNSFGRLGYSGPCPPRGAGPHHYLMTVYGLDRILDLKAGADPHAAVAAIKAAAVAAGSITGVYSR